jgi:superfamily II DNA/RNA helicase
MLEAGMGFTAEVSQLMSILKSKDPPAATVLVTATMSKAVKQLVTAYLPDLQRIEAQGFHKAVATASHSFR